MTQSPLRDFREVNSRFDEKAHEEAVANTLDSIKHTISVGQLSYMSNLPETEIAALQKEVASVIPAGNILGLVLTGLANLRDRTLPPDRARSDVSALLRGIEVLPKNILPRALYGTLFVGPAAALYAYQKLLQLTGKDSDSAFPDGLWQFYLEMAMREDTARHANETIGFHQVITEYNLNLSQADQLAAWVCAVNQSYFQYDSLLYNEWRERVYLHLLQAAVKEANLDARLSFQRLGQAWAAQRPYQRGQDAQHHETYAMYRKRRFDSFWESRLQFLPHEHREKLNEAYKRRVEDELTAYQHQMSILATLDPERYRENRTPIPLWQTKIAVIYENNYYLLPTCFTDNQDQPLLFETPQTDAPSYPLAPTTDGYLQDPAGRLVWVERGGRVYDTDTRRTMGYLKPAHFQLIRRLIAAIFNRHRGLLLREAGALPMLDDQLLRVPRVEQERARNALPPEAQREVDALKQAPVIINWDVQDSRKAIADIRRGKRGLGDHALTLFPTERSMIFDQSHIFFDGVWGMALSEILTGEAISWAVYFNSLSPAQPSQYPPHHLPLQAQASLTDVASHVTHEASVENTSINTRNLYRLTRLLTPERYKELKLTVNDLLILFRSQFGHEYHPSAELRQSLSTLQVTTGAMEVYTMVEEALVKATSKNPAMVIPMDATATKPRERLYPTTFRSPLTDMWSMYQNALELLETYQKTSQPEDWMAFDNARRSLLAQLNYFGQLLRAYKRVALEGGSTATATLKLMAHLPPALFQLLDQIPRRIEILNEVIKGEEVFSNVGRVARGSSLVRFVSAKDDNENKAMVWGLLTDDADQLCVTLRDFRPHVAALHEFGQPQLAEQIAQDYLDGFAHRFNQFVANLLSILKARAIKSEVAP